MFPFWIDLQMTSLPELLVALTGTMAVLFGVMIPTRSVI